MPAEGALVCCRRTGTRGVVVKHEPRGSEVRLRVRWGGTNNLPPTVGVYDVASGFQRGDEVLETATDPSGDRGQGVVVQTRKLGGMEQALVEFWDAEVSVWLPWQNLRAVPGVKAYLTRNVPPPAGSAERFRLRNLAYALEQWHGNTGALSRLNLDPLPHQIHLVHRILASGDTNWLIADDVGLGKTIEVGMLISALRQRGFRRVLLVVPAGLTRQWQEELRDKFFMDEFRIYGRDFNIHETRHWRMENFVIGSVDRFKAEGHLEKLRHSGQWDLVVFDEAHRLGRSEYGLSYEISDRYRLAQLLRQQTEHMLLLSGTPHQGKDDRFRALLELLRPGREWKKRIDRLRADPSFLNDLIIRNRKADVTDAHGNFIFKGKLTRTVQVQTSAAELAFDDSLRRYLLEGYRASREKGVKGIAIGFVMTTYRKLAASSILAIEQSLTRRKKRLLGELVSAARKTEGDEPDERYVEQDEQIETGATEFFDGEIELLDALVAQARELVPQDSKLKFFIGELMADVLRRNPDEKVLVFTEYRSTQEYLVAALERHFGPGKVDRINGGMTIDERREAIRHFEDEGQFIVSTEAGGEGLNLQRRCHIMVNFDLPWNPMRLVQRVGRIYRYGQDKPVVVFNVQVPNTLDADILNQMYVRLEQIARDMASVSDTYQREGLHEDILGDLVELVDVKEVLDTAATYSPERSAARLEEALARARDAVAQQNELLSFASGYDPSELRDELQLSTEHLASFARGMFAAMGIEVAQELHGGRVWALRLPVGLQQQLSRNQNLRITFDRSMSSRLRDVTLLNADDPLLQLMFAKAKDYAFGGHTAAVTVAGRAALGAMLRWQNDRGLTLRQEYIGIVLQGNAVSTNGTDWGEWLKEPATDVATKVCGGQTLLERFMPELDRRLQLRSNANMYPSSWHAVGAAWGSEST